MSNFLSDFLKKKNMGEIPSGELNTVATTAIESILRLADEYGKDRDEVCFIFSSRLFEFVINSSFKHYEFGGNEK